MAFGWGPESFQFFRLRFSEMEDLDLRADGFFLPLDGRLWGWTSWWQGKICKRIALWGLGKFITWVVDLFRKWRRRNHELPKKSLIQSRRGWFQQLSKVFRVILAEVSTFPVKFSTGQLHSDEHGCPDEHPHLHSCRIGPGSQGFRKLGLGGKQKLYMLF